MIKPCGNGVSKPSEMAGRMHLDCQLAVLASHECDSIGTRPTLHTNTSPSLARCGSVGPGVDWELGLQ